ncbi:TPA-induced transmembrane protein isoform X1 [Dendropsophus ebraccatus]|uniref:TPA-induced transmembrane protein isoform X1 n=1 Tax=Dendropsophus ebraccatus TaxID=150705 RepID=UPI003831DAB5
MDSNQNHRELLPFIVETPNNVKKQHRIRIPRNPKLWIGLVFLMVIVVIIISLVLYSTGNLELVSYHLRFFTDVYYDKDEQNLMNRSSSNITCSYTGFVNVSDPCVWDSWIKNETMFQERITSVYSMSPFLKNFFIAAKVDYNSADDDKSAVIHLDFARPSTKYLFSPELVEGILRQDMYEKSECQDANVLKDSMHISVTSM